MHNPGVLSGRTSLLVLSLVSSGVLAVLGGDPAASAAAPPDHALEVTGAGVATYPAFDPAIERYAVTTTGATGGTVTVHASTTDPAGVVRVDGRVAPGGTATVTGLTAGDEVSVFIEDSAGAEVHSLVYLPAGFPALEAVTSAPGLADGQIALTMFQLSPAVPRFNATVDRNGVPGHVEQVSDSIDLKQQPDGRITVTRPTTTAEKTGWATVVRDDHWREVATYETRGLKHTDNHDSVLLPDGSRFLLAYELNADTGKTDAVVQEQDATGQVVFEWSTLGLEGESARPGTDPDYAHVNSIQVVGPERDVVVSFRHLSSVFRIATRDHGDYEQGDVIWKLGGRDSDFDFVDDPDGGPCAQHSAHLLPDGNLLLFDNGSGAPGAQNLCIDQADPSAAATPRPRSRAVEYQLDLTAGTARRVWDYTPVARYSPFMGSTARLGNGHTLIGWGGSTQALASEVAADDSLLWELRVAPPVPYISYRANLVHVPDAFAPVIDEVSPADGATYVEGQQVAVDFRCSDRGGSSLRSCAGDVRPGGALDTSTPGAHTVHLTARDGAGNTTTVTRTYTVAALSQPGWSRDRIDKVLRAKRVSATVRLVNDGARYDAFRLRGTRGSAGFRVRYKLEGRDVTNQVVRGRLHTDGVDPGEGLVLKVVVERTARTRPGAHRTFKVTAISVASLTRQASVKIAVRAR